MKAVYPPMKISKFGTIYHGILIAEQPLDPQHINQPNAPIHRTGVECVICGKGRNEKRESYLIDFKLYSETDGIAIVQLHMWRLDFKINTGETEFIRILDKFVREVLITPDIRKHLGIDAQSFPSQLDFEENESQELENLKAEMEQRNIELSQDFFDLEHEPLWKANLEQFEQLRCQATVSGDISASQAIIEPNISTQKKEVS